MTKDELMLAHEGVMQEACNQCRWPLEYEDEEAMYAEQCDHCQIDAQLTAALEAAAKPPQAEWIPVFDQDDPDEPYMEETWGEIYCCSHCGGRSYGGAFCSHCGAKMKEVPA